MKLSKKLAAEFIGTFWLVLGGWTSPRKAGLSGVVSGNDGMGSFFSIYLNQTFCTSMS